jgi:mono/diheme cytochrome c family protein
MHLIHLKTGIAIFFLAVGGVAGLTMLDLMGRKEHKVPPRTLTRAHKAAGVVFTLLLVVLAYLGARLVASMGDAMSTRAALHAVLAAGLIGVFAVKLLIVLFYRELLRFVPALGIVVFVLAIMVFLSSAGYYFVRLDDFRAAAPREAAAVGESGMEEVPRGAEPETYVGGDVDAGRGLFASKCAFCHAADSRAARNGPGLEGILTRDKLPSSGRPATRENIVLQLEDPVGTMPAFGSLTDGEMADLIAYLETL